MSNLSLVLEFSGGAELLFGNKKSFEIELPGDKEWAIKELLIWIKVCLLYLFILHAC